MKPKKEIKEWANRIKDGDRQALSQAITLIESSNVEDRQLAQSLIDFIEPWTGNSLRIGITGPPGVGKSTLIDKIGVVFIGQSHKVAVLTIDPTSALSKGSILGDKSRMASLSAQANAYIRPSPSSLNLGGLALYTREAMLLCEAAGFDRILIESVGVGQSEFLISLLCDMTLLLLQPHSGDEMQGIKRGVMEWADMYIITKTDGETFNGSNKTYIELNSILNFVPRKYSFWAPKIVQLSVISDLGMSSLMDNIDLFHNLLINDNQLYKLRLKQSETYFKVQWAKMIEQYILMNRANVELINFLAAEVGHGNMSSEKAFDKLLKFIFATLK